MLLLSVIRQIAEEARANRLRSMVNAAKVAVPVSELKQAGIETSLSGSVKLPFVRGY